MREKLTTLAIEKLPHPDSGYKMYWDTVVPGFGVRVTAKSKSFFIIYGRRRQSKALGKYPAISLKQARDEAKRLQLDIASDTPQLRLESLFAVREAYLSECEAKNARKTTDQYRLFLGKVDKPTLSDVTLHDIDVSSPHAVMA